MAKRTSARSKKTSSVKAKESPIECGLVMPISEIDGCSAEHWEQVREIIEEALNNSNMRTSMVSDADEVGIIQDRIVKNLYQNPIVVCDVSCKNPNVMFELGLRLAFDKPTVVIKDDKTAYSFDTSPIEHIPYPRNLNYRGMVKFKKVLKQKVDSTLKAATDKNYSSFLGSFTIKNLVSIPTDDLPPSEYYSSELKDLKTMVSRLVSNQHSLLKATNHSISSKWTKEGIYGNESKILEDFRSCLYRILIDKGENLSNFELLNILRDSHSDIIAPLSMGIIRREITRAKKALSGNQG